MLKSVIFQTFVWMRDRTTVQINKANRLGLTILRFEITMNDLSCVKKTQPRRHLPRYTPDFRLRNSFHRIILEARFDRLAKIDPTYFHVYNIERKPFLGRKVFEPPMVSDVYDVA